MQLHEGLQRRSLALVLKQHEGAPEHSVVCIPGVQHAGAVVRHSLSKHLRQKGSAWLL